MGSGQPTGLGLVTSATYSEHDHLLFARIEFERKLQSGARIETGPTSSGQASCTQSGWMSGITTRAEEFPAVAGPRRWTSIGSEKSHLLRTFVMQRIAGIEHAVVVLGEDPRG